MELLLGANVSEAVIQQEVRVGQPGQPIAVRIAFGWTLTGAVSDLSPEKHGRTRRAMFIQKGSAAEGPRQKAVQGGGAAPLAQTLVPTTPCPD